ncbi:MAG: hypothetical protein KDJ41_16815 [Hyphomicrobiaceae bacterium]|nr:hypothetical protein [Hyphomicrobiaceae bacterium]
MTRNTSRQSGLARLQAVLAAYGADQSRWPATDRQALGLLVANDPEARRLVAEAAALDRLLDRKPVALPSGQDELIARIMAAATTGGNESARPDAEASGGKVIALSPGRRAPRAAFTTRSRPWEIAALLAASLIIGVYIGAAGLADPAFSGLVASAPSQTQSDEISTLEEDLL